MKTIPMQKRGNSYVIRIPKALIDRLQLPPNAQFEIREERGAILLIPVRPAPSLEEMLAQVTPHNRHGEIDFGPGMDGDAWDE